MSSILSGLAPNVTVRLLLEFAETFKKLQIKDADFEEVPLFFRHLTVNFNFLSTNKLKSFSLVLCFIQILYNVN